MLPSTTTTRHYTLHVDVAQAGVRLDVFLSTAQPIYSRSFLQRAIKNGMVEVNAKIITKHSFVLKAQDVINLRIQEISYDKLNDLEPSDSLAVMYEHEHFLIINKPAGLSVHPSGHSLKNKEFTLTDILVGHYAPLAHVGADQRPGIVHRLDKHTSGLIIIAKTAYAYSTFSKLFEQRFIKKRYIGIVQGHPEAQGIVEFPLCRDPFNRTKMTHRLLDGRASSTTYRVITYYAQHALVHFYPLTGRTHQIRVHATAIGHPLEGDIVYGSASSLIGRHALHAAQLTFDFDNELFNFEAPLPDDMNTLIEKLPAVFVPK